MTAQNNIFEPTLKFNQKTSELNVHVSSVSNVHVSNDSIRLS